MWVQSSYASFIPARVSHNQHRVYADELIRTPKFPDYQIRLKSPSICDASVQQYSGYFDVAGDKHLFFW